MLETLLQIPFRRLSPHAAPPARAHSGDAGYDLCAAEEAVLAPGERALVGTGIALALPEGYGGFVLPRSGLASRHGISLVNAPGLIDSGYRGELRVPLINHDREHTFTVAAGMRVAQLVVMKVEAAAFLAVDSLSGATDGRDGRGFGSSGV